MDPTAVENDKTAAGLDQERAQVSLGRVCVERLADSTKGPPIVQPRIGLRGSLDESCIAEDLLPEFVGKSIGHGISRKASSLGGVSNRCKAIFRL